jgi:hypothetical protein
MHHGLAEIRRVLVWIMDNLGMARRRLEILANLMSQGIQVTNDDLKIVLAEMVRTTINTKGEGLCPDNIQMGYVHVRHQPRRGN